jgi:ABC-2 type transport system permease protein
MMFLSGVFFSREVLPTALQVITDYLPLTYLVEAIRGMTVQGDSIVAQWPNFLGLAVWLVVAFVIANRTFRWE